MSGSSENIGLRLTGDPSGLQRAMQQGGAAVTQFGRQAEQSLNSVGMSAKQTAFALRGVPAQFTDIFTSLQSGQKPMTVLLQQGGQLKDMFGGIGPAARALGGYMLGMVNPVTLAAGAIAGLAYGAFQGAKEMREFQNAGTMTGHALGVSNTQFVAMRENLAGIVGTRGKAAEVLTGIAASGKLAGANVMGIAEAAIQMERATGQAVEKTIKQFVDLAEKPSEASAKANESINYLTAGIYAQIKALEEQGDKAGAADLAIRTLADTTADRAKSIVENAGYIEQAWSGVLGVLKKVADATMNIGRDQSLGQQLASVRGEIAAATGQDKNRRHRLPWEESLESLRQREAFLQEQVRLMQRLAEAAAQRAANTKAYIDWDRQGAEFKTKEAKRDEEVRKAEIEGRALVNAGLITEMDLHQRIAAIRGKDRDKGGGAARNKEAEHEVRLLAQLAGLNGDYLEKLEILQGARARGRYTEAEYIELVRQLIALQPMAIKLTQEQAAAQQQVERADIAAAMAREKYLVGLLSGLDKIHAEILSQEEHTQRLGLTKAAIAELDAAKVEMMATDIELRAIRTYDRNLDEVEYASLMRQAAAWRAVATAKRAGASKAALLDLDAANEEAAKHAQQQWQRAADSINDSLTDALLRGFESGKDFAENFRDTLKNMFSTLVLRPMIQGVMAPVSGAISGMLGQQGGGMLGNTLSSFGLSQFLGAGSMGSLASGGGLIGSAVNALGLGATAGSSFASTIGAGLATDAMGATVAAGAASTGGAGILGALAPAMPYLAPLLLLAPLLSGAFKGETRSGGQYVNAEFSHGPSGGQIGAVGESLSATIGSINQTLQALGSTATLSILRSGLESSEKGKGFAYAGGQLSTGAVFGQGITDQGYMNRRGSKTPEQAAAEFSEELKQATLQALQAADVPGQLGDYLRQLGDIDALSGGALDAALGRINKALTEKTTLEEQLYTLTHTELEMLNRTRERERDAIDESNLVLLEQVYAQQDLKTAVEAANQTMSATRSALQEVFSSLRGMHQAVDQANEGVLDARGEIADAYWSAQDRLNNLLEQSRQATLAFSSSLSDYLAGLSGGQFATETAGGQYQSLLRRLSETAARAQGGDQNARDGLTGAADSFLTAAQARSSSAVEFAKDRARVRTMLSGVMATLPASAQPGAAPSLDEQILAADEEVKKYLKLANDTGTSIESATLSVADKIEALRSSYEAARAEQVAANARLDVALLALESFGLTETSLTALLSGRTGASVGDFATALGVSDETINALQAATGWTDEELQELSDALNVTVAPTVLAALGGSLGIPPSLAEQLAAGLGVSPLQMMALETALGMDPADAEMLLSVLSLTPAQRAELGSALGVDAAQIPALATALGVDSSLLANLSTVFGISDAAQTVIGTLGTVVGFSDAAVALGLSLADVAGFSPAAIAAIDALATQAGFSAEARQVYEGLAARVGFNPEALSTVGVLGTSVGLQSGLDSYLSQALGLSSGALSAISALVSATSERSSSVGLIEQAYASIGRTGYGDAANQIDSAGFQYWLNALSTGAVSASGFQEAFLRDARAYVEARPSDPISQYVAPYLEKLPRFAVGTNYVPRAMAAIVDEGEAIVPKAYNPAAGGNDLMLVELRASRLAAERTQADISAMRRQIDAIATATERTDRTLQAVTLGGGTALRTTVV